MKVLYVTEFTDMTTPEHTRTYRITKQVNTIRHAIGENLSRFRVQDYCSSSEWKVIITNPKIGV